MHRFAGFSNVVLLAPLFPILHYTGIEPFELPKSKAIWVHCIVNMLICVSSDYIYMIGESTTGCGDAVADMLAMLKTTPAGMYIFWGYITSTSFADYRVATIGLSLTIPLTLFCSFFIPGGAAITFLTLGGAVMVCGAIGILGWEGWKDSKLIPSPEEEEA
jgi:solute carrier family 35 protein F5